MLLSIDVWADIMAFAVVIAALAPSLDHNENRSHASEWFRFLFGFVACLWLLLSIMLDGCVFTVCL